MARTEAVRGQRTVGERSWITGLRRWVIDRTRAAGGRYAGIARQVSRWPRLTLPRVTGSPRSIASSRWENISTTAASGTPGRDERGGHQRCHPDRGRGQYQHVGDGGDPLAAPGAGQTDARRFRTCTGAGV